MDSKYIPALVFKAHLLYRQRRMKDLLSVYEDVLRIDRLNEETLYNKACLCSHERREIDSTSSLTKAIRIDPRWRYVASKDSDLYNVRNNKRFRDLSWLM